MGSLWLQAAAVILSNSAENIVPLLASLRIIHEFDVEVQTQYFSPLALDLPTDGNGTTLDIEHLKAFVNTAQWNLGQSLLLLWL